MVQVASYRVLVTAFSTGKTHDFALFKRSRPPLQNSTWCLADSGYQGIDQDQENRCTPYKKSKLQALCPQRKRCNRELARERIRVEHVIRWLKRFRILAGPYRNRRKRFALRFNLIAAIYNAHRDL